MRELLIPGQNCPSISMVWNSSEPNNNLGPQRFSHLDIPINSQYLSGNIILIFTGKCLNTIMMLVTNTMNSATYQTNIDQY